MFLLENVSKIVGPVLDALSANGLTWKSDIKMHGSIQGSLMEKAKKCKIRKFRAVLW